LGPAMNELTETARRIIEEKASAELGAYVWFHREEIKTLRRDGVRWSVLAEAACRLQVLDREGKQPTAESFRKAFGRTSPKKTKQPVVQQQRDHRITPATQPHPRHPSKIFED